MESFEALKKYFVICNLRDEPWWYYAKWNEPIKKKKKTIIAWFHICEVPKLIKSMETENIIVVAKDYEEEELENCCSVCVRLQSCKMKKFYRFDVEQGVHS